MGTRAESLTDQWTALTVDSDGKAVSHDTPEVFGKVWLTTIDAAPANYLASANVGGKIMYFDQTEVSPGEFTAERGEKVETGGQSGGWYVDGHFDPLRWRYRLSVASSSAAVMEVSVWKENGQKIVFPSNQIYTGIQLKGKHPTSAANTVNFTNTAKLESFAGGYEWRLQWALSAAEITNYADEGRVQFEMATSTTQKLATFLGEHAGKQTHPPIGRGISLDRGQAVVLKTPATGSWYHRAERVGLHVWVE